MIPGILLILPGWPSRLWRGFTWGRRARFDPSGAPFLHV